MNRSWAGISDFMVVGWLQADDDETASLTIASINQASSEQTKLVNEMIARKRCQRRGDDGHFPSPGLLNVWVVPTLTKDSDEEGC